MSSVEETTNAVRDYIACAINFGENTPATVEGYKAIIVVNKSMETLGHVVDALADVCATRDM